MRVLCLIKQKCGLKHKGWRSSLGLACHKWACECFYVLLLLPGIKNKVCHLRQHSQCLTATALYLQSVFAVVFFFSFHVGFLSWVEVWGKKDNTGGRSKCDRKVLISDDAFIPVGGGLYGVSQLWDTAGAALALEREKKKKINMELLSSFLCCWHSYWNHKGELTEKE